MRELAERSDIDLGILDTQPGTGRFSTVDMSSDRGVISVLLGVQRRLFSIAIRDDVHPWASGGTDDLSAVVGVADAWRRGASLRALVDRFPFMSISHLAEAYESGDPVSAQWDSLLGDAEFRHVAPVLLAIHQVDRLRTLFPYVSHGTIRLALDVMDRSRGEIWIARLRNGRFRVESTTRGESGKETGSMEDAIEAALSYLP
ncbi:DUF6193 family natural product biosynthesis protein [Nonomuraea sp. NPDC052129]|uniref:DUF6193 family natural product biosynthesis protein n=1 Tax=Nonomuraea sp. NPDC052129 TaxID=3154651 RepID=UPI00342CA4D1